MAVLPTLMALWATLGIDPQANPELFDIPKKIGRDRIDVASTRAILEHTTDVSYLSPWVDHLPEDRRVPSPTEFLGHVVGAAGHLTPPEKINDYFRLLATKSKRIQVLDMGKSHGGRDMIAVVIGTPKNLRRLDDIAAANHELADPRVTDESKARRLAKKTPPIYYMTAGLHSPETGPPEMVMELAYRLIASEQDHIREIRKNVVVMITPVLEMDGRARMVDWWERNLEPKNLGEDDFDDMPPRMAPYWGDYTAHDNNRDGLQLTQPLTRNYVEHFHRYLPVLTLDLHESVPLLYVSTGTGPYNRSIDPITIGEWQWISNYEVTEATKHGLPGVWTWGFYTGWYPGYILWVSNNHNATGRFYETFGNTHPGTFDRNLRKAEMSGRRINSRQWYRASPPAREVKWSLRNNTNYMQTGVLASLQLAARNGETLLFNFWKKGHNAVARGKKEAPHAFVIPHDQRDRAALHELLSLLHRHRIEVHTATKSANFGKNESTVEIEAGDYVVRLDQPYRNLAETLLKAAPFPKTAEHTPYDDVAWSLDLMLGVEVEAIDDVEVLALSMDPQAKVPALEGRVQGEGPRFVVPHHGQAKLASLRWALPKNAKVTALTAPLGGHPAGSLVIEGVSKSELQTHCAKLHLMAHSLAEVPKETIDVDLPTVAIFHTWTYTQDSGWLRYALETLDLPFILIDKDDLRSGKLRQRFDVIIVPNQAGMSFADIVHGVDERFSPLPYTTTKQTPSHGVIDSSEDITGGMGFDGLAELDRFVAAGGTLVTLGSAGRLAADGGLARRVRSVGGADSPGSHVTTKVLRPEHPLAFGYDETDWVFRGNLPLFDVPDQDRGMTVMQFGTKTWAEAEADRDEKADMEPEVQPDPAQNAQDAQDNQDNENTKAPALARSGIVKKPEAIERKPAILDVPSGKGRVVMYAFNPVHRHQNQHDFALLFNALLFWNDLPAPLDGKTMRAR